MDLINSNPFRTLGLLAGTKASEQSRQIKRLKQFIEAEQEPDADFSFPILGDFLRTLESVADAEQKINLDNDKMNAALFWFYNGNTITDEPAFDFLTDGNIDEAKSIWTKLTTSSNVNERNSSAFQNLSTLILYNAFSIDNSQIEKGISLKLQFLESEFVNYFVKIVTDETYKTTNLELQILFLNQLQTEIEKSKIFSTVDFLKVLNNLSFSAKEDFFKIFVQKPIEEIEKIITETKTKRKSDKTKSIEFGNELFNSTREYLEQIKSTTGETNIKFISISDKVADEILQCGIEYFNFFKDLNTNSGENSMILFRKSETLAIGNIITERIKENIEVLQIWIKSTNEILNNKKKCWYCNKNEADEKFIYETDVYKVISRGGVIQKNVKYTQSKIRVDRCEECNEIHSKGVGIIIMSFLVPYILSFIWLYLYIIKPENRWFPVLPFLFVGWVPAGIVAWIVNFIISNINAKKYNIRTEDDIESLIRKTLGSGWSTSKPSAK